MEEKEHWVNSRKKLITTRYIFYCKILSFLLRKSNNIELFLTELNVLSNNLIDFFLTREENKKKMHLFLQVKILTYIFFVNRKNVVKELILKSKRSFLYRNSCSIFSAKLKDTYFLFIHKDLNSETCLLANKTCALTNSVFYMASLTTLH